MFTKLSECHLTILKLKLCFKALPENGKQTLTLASPCISSNCVGVYVCVWSTVTRLCYVVCWWGLWTQQVLYLPALCAPSTPKRERPPSLHKLWCGPDPPHMCGTGADLTNADALRQPQRDTAIWYWYFWEGGSPERESRRRRVRGGDGKRKNDMKRLASKPFPLLFCEAASSNQSDVLSRPSECPDGFYGLDCGQMCECRNGARCHHITGACLCTAGWAGPHCILGNGSHIIKTGCEGGPHCGPSRHPLLKHN